jgi:hypothetical protein
MIEQLVPMDHLSLDERERTSQDVWAFELGVSTDLETIK